MAGQDETPTLRLGRYRILGMLGSGGMGQVLRARDPKLNRDVAIKVVRDSTDENTARLLREARTMAALSHPNVVPVYDVDKDAGELFIAMELVEGITVRQWLADPRSWQSILDVYTRAGRGLAAAHAAGLVHRDFKPANVMMEVDEDEQPQRVLVLDFGLARAASDDVITARSRDPDTTSRGSVVVLDTDRLTRTGDVMGTPYYLAPEQETGAKATPASDQYSFCVAVYEALYGLKPFDADTYERLSLQKWKMEIVPPERTDAPAALYDVIVRGLSVVPGRRWPSILELLDALEAARTPRRWRRWASVAVGGGLALGTAAVLVEGEPSSCESGSREAAGVWSEDRRAAAESAFGDVATATSQEAWSRISGSLDTYFDSWAIQWGAACGEAENPEADRQRTCLRRALRDADVLVGVLTTVDRESVGRSVDAVASLPDLDRCGPGGADRWAEPPAQLAEEVARVDEVLARVETTWLMSPASEALAIFDREIEAPSALGHCPTRARARLWSGRLADGSGDFERALPELEAAFVDATSCDQHLVATVAARYLAAIHNGQTSNLEAAAKWFGHARTQLTLIEDEHDRRAEEAILLYSYAPALERSGRVEDALEMLSESRLRLEPIKDEEPGLWAEFLNSQGSMLMSAGRYEEALKAYREAIDVQEAAYGRSHPIVAIGYGNLGLAFHSLSRYEQALQAQEKSVELMPAAYGPNHPYVIRSQHMVAQTLDMLGRDDEALRRASSALELAERVLPEDSREIDRVIRTIAEIEAGRDNDELALQYQQELVDRGERAGARDETYVWDIIKLGERLVTAQRHDEARYRLQQATEAHEAQEQNSPMMSGRLAATWAYLHHEQGRLEDADRDFREAIGHMEPLGGGTTYPLAEVLEAYGEMLIDAGRPDEAKAALKRTLEIYAASGADPEDSVRVRKLVSRADEL